MMATVQIAAPAFAYDLPEADRWSCRLPQRPFVTRSSSMTFSEASDGSIGVKLTTRIQNVLSYVADRVIMVSDLMVSEVERCSTRAETAKARTGLETRVGNPAVCDCQVTTEGRATQFEQPIQFYFRKLEWACRLCIAPVEKPIRTEVRESVSLDKEHQLDTRLSLPVHVFPGADSNSPGLRRTIGGPHHPHLSAGTPWDTAREYGSDPVRTDPAEDDSKSLPLRLLLQRMTGIHGRTIVETRPGSGGHAMPSSHSHPSRRSSGSTLP